MTGRALRMLRPRLAMIGVALLLLLALLGILRVPSRYRLALWTVVILGCVVPWSDYVGHAHWYRVGWWPFLSPPVRLRDLAANGLLYVPFGAFLTSRPSQGRGWSLVWRAAFWGTLLSAATEATQVFSHGRFPTMTDVVMNALGAGTGAMLAGRMGFLDRRPTRDAVHSDVTPP